MLTVAETTADQIADLYAREGKFNEKTLQPAANAGVLNFLSTDFTSRSITLLDGRAIAHAKISPVSSSIV